MPLKYLVAVCLGLAAPLAQAQDAEQYTLSDLGGGVYVIGGSHNAGLIVGQHGAMLVDSRVEGDFAHMQQQIARATHDPVAYVISTHYHPDHVGSNAAFHHLGATIVGHANLAARMLHPPELNPHTGQPLPPAPADALPTITYTDRITIDIGGTEAQLVHMAAHTDGDTIVVLPRQNVIFAGDVVMMAYDPPDISAGGSIDGLIAATDFIIARSDAQTRIVPGHLRVMSRADVVAFRDMLATARDRIARAKTQGMSEDQVVSAHLLHDMDDRWMGPGGPVITSFVRIVYRSIP